VFIIYHLFYFIGNGGEELMTQNITYILSCITCLTKIVNGYNHFIISFEPLTLIKIFKYMNEFFISILVIKDICEVISGSLVIVQFFLLLQIGPKNLGNIIFYIYNIYYYKFIIYNIDNNFF
jgi:hypothetical protein